MVPQIWSATTFLSFWTAIQKMKKSPGNNYQPPLPPNNLKNQKNQNFEKMRKPLGDIITLHLCALNDNHMMYGS